MYMILFCMNLSHINITLHSPAFGEKFFDFKVIDQVDTNIFAYRSEHVVSK